MNAAVAKTDAPAAARSPAPLRALGPFLRPYSGRIAGLGVDGLMMGPVDEALAVAADALGRPEQAGGYRAAAAKLRDRLAAEARGFID